MVLSKQLKFECIHCGNCCCDPNTIVNTTYLDIIRIKNDLHLTIREVLDILGFYIFEDKLSQESLSKMVISPIYTEKGLAFVALRKGKSGACIFYNKKKKRCSIYSLRPNFCRTFPFYFSYSFKKDEVRGSELFIDYTNKGLEYCEGISENSPIISYESWLDLGTKVLKGLIENEKFTTKWNDNIKTHKIKPTAENYLLNILKENFQHTEDL